MAPHLCITTCLLKSITVHSTVTNIIMPKDVVACNWGDRQNTINQMSRNNLVYYKLNINTIQIVNMHICIFSFNYGCMHPYLNDVCVSV